MLLFGKATDEPVVGDWDGNGVTDPGVFDQASATFTLRLIDAAGVVQTTPLKLGAPGDLPVTGDWDANEGQRPRRLGSSDSDLHPGSVVAPARTGVAHVDPSDVGPYEGHHRAVRPATRLIRDSHIIIIAPATAMRINSTTTATSETTPK